MSFNLLIWLFTGAVTLHNLEEALWLPGWTKTLDRWPFQVEQRQFRFAVVVLTMLVYALAALAMVGGAGSIGAYLVSGYALAMLVNVFLPHVLATLATRRYAPDAATAIVLNLPITLLLLHRGFEKGIIEKMPFIYVGPLVASGILLLIPLLFYFAKRTGH